MLFPSESLQQFEICHNHVNALSASSCEQRAFKHLLSMLLAAECLLPVFLVTLHVISVHAQLLGATQGAITEWLTLYQP